jgi:undecaprenyl-diphosphatase
MADLAPNCLRDGEARRRCARGPWVVPRDEGDRRSDREGDEGENEKGHRVELQVSLDRRQGNLESVSTTLSDSAVRLPSVREKSEQDDRIHVLEAAPDGPAETIGGSLPRWHPAIVFLLGVVFCYAALAGLSTLIGLAFTTWILPLDGLASADARPVEWMEGQRTPYFDALSYVGSEVSGGFVIPALVGAVVIISAFQRRWLLAGFVLAAIVLESATYRTTVFFIDRDRPDVERLEGLPVDHSFPSGHVAASIAAYCGFALLLTTTRFTSTRARTLIWSVALLIPPIVAISRMYRGMHHPLDMLAGVIIGILALSLALLLARATAVVKRRREARAA